MKLKAEIKTYFQERTPREKFILMLGALAIVVIFGYLISSTLSADLNTLKTQHQTDRQTLRFLKHASAKIQALQAAGYKPQGQKPSDLIGQVNQLLNQKNLSGLNPSLQQTNANQLTLSFLQVPFDRLIGFLQILWTQYDIGVETADIKPLAKEGLVQVKLGIEEE